MHMACLTTPLPYVAVQYTSTVYINVKAHLLDFSALAFNSSTAPYTIKNQVVIRGACF